MGEQEYDIWYKVGRTYKCGCCGKIPTFIDIRDMIECPKCRHHMRGYETENGIEPLTLEPPKEEDRTKWRRIPY